MGKVIILPETPKDPISLIGRRAGICYGADISDPEKNYKRGIDCIKSGHGRALEYVDIHAHIKGYSAKVIREWYTHIGGGPTRLQESTRYIEYKDFDYITPPTIQSNPDAAILYNKVMATIQDAVETLEKIYGIPKEDASMLLPFGMTTGIVDKRNARNLMDMSRNRQCNRAFWEFRDGLFADYIYELSHYAPQWDQFLTLIIFPKCVELGYCPEAKGCGMYPPYRT